MTDKEKAKAYDEAIERAKDYHNDYTKDIVEDIFPELKESEDERIRQRFIKLVKMSSEVGGFALHKWEAEEMLAWLEKQGNQTIFNTPSRETILAIWELGNDWKELTRKELTNGVISTEHGTQLDYIQKHWSESEHYLRERRKQKPTSNEQQGKSALEAIHEQNPNNKPKFNVDDWICNSACIVHIASIKDGMYYFDEGDGLDITFVDNNYHLWTIADAKDGDVLYLQKDGKEHIIIYKGVTKERFRTFVSAYCAYNGIVDAFCFADVSRYADIAYGSIMPATRKQRDQLEKAMADAGWEFDFDKKELKKIVQQTSAWSEGDDAYKLFAISAVEDYYDEKNPLHKDIVDWLESLKERVVWKQSKEQIRALRWVLNNIPYNTHKEEISELLEQIKDL